jgi:hypothetical protein
VRGRLRGARSARAVAHQRAHPHRPRRSYAHWKKAADAAKPVVHEATRRHESRVHLDDIREKVKKVAYKFTVLGDSDAQEVELSDEAVMESIKAEDEALAAKVAAPEEIRLGYYV